MQSTDSAVVQCTGFESLSTWRLSVRFVFEWQCLVYLAYRCYYAWLLPCWKIAFVLKWHWCLRSTTCRLQAETNRSCSRSVFICCQCIYIASVTLRFSLANLSYSHIASSTDRKDAKPVAGGICLCLDQSVHFFSVSIFRCFVPQHYWHIRMHLPTGSMVCFDGRKCGLYHGTGRRLYGTLLSNSFVSSFWHFYLCILTDGYLLCCYYSVCHTYCWTVSRQVFQTFKCLLLIKK